MQRMKTQALCVLGAFIFLWTASQAHAFIPSVRWILNRTVALYLESPVKSIRVSMEGHEISPESQRMARQEHIYFQRGYNFRREVTQGQQNLVEIMGDGRVMQRSVDFPAEVFPEFLQLYYSLHNPKEGPKGAAALAAALERTGVDTSVVSINRYGSEVVWVIGAKPWEEQRTQVWLTKSHFRPVRAILNQHGNILDWRFLGQQAFDDAPFLFSGLELWQNGRLIRKLEVTKFRMNKKLSKDLFSKS